MKYKAQIIFGLIILVGVPAAAQKFTVGSYNIRYDNPRDSGNLWINRAPVVSNLIRFHDFDVFGVQEALKHQLDYINEALPYYSRYGRGRDDGKEKGEHSSVYYKKDKFTLLYKGDFWLSQTPDKPSLGWDATCCHRICSWVYLQEKASGKKFYFFNAHYDHQGREARRESSKLILKKIKEIAGDAPVIFTGDLNGDQHSEWYMHIANSQMLKDAFTETQHPYANNASFNGFRTSFTGNRIIDHIFITPHFKVSKWGILTDTYFGKFPSDHFPILAVVELK